jgi:hypothetical protein
MVNYKSVFTPREINITSPYYWGVFITESIVKIPYIGTALFFVLFISFYMGFATSIALLLGVDSAISGLIVVIIIMSLMYFIAKQLEKLHDSREVKFRKKIFTKLEKEINIYNKFMSDCVTNPGLLKEPTNYIKRTFEELGVSHTKDLVFNLKRLHFNSLKKFEGTVNTSYLKPIIKSL